MSSDHEMVMTDDQVLSFVQGKRKALIDDMTTKGMPSDNEDRNTFLRTLEGMSATALANKRMKKEEDMNADHHSAKNLIRGIVTAFGGKDPFAVDAQNPIKPHELPAQLVDDFKAVEGEMEVGVSSENYSQFVDRMDNK